MYAQLLRVRAAKNDRLSCNKYYIISNSFFVYVCMRVCACACACVCVHVHVCVRAEASFFYEQLKQCKVAIDLCLSS